MTGDAYLFGRLGGFSGGVSLAEPLLPASSLTRNTRNGLTMAALPCCRGAPEKPGSVHRRARCVWVFWYGARFACAL